MRKILTTLILILTSASIAIASSRTPIEVTRIIDGDTIEAKIKHHKNFRIRLIDIDCYETSNIHRAYRQAYENKLTIEEVIKRGVNSKQFLENLYFKNGKASIDFKGIDPYGRALGVVYFDNVNVNKALLKDGGCYAYQP